MERVKKGSVFIGVWGYGQTNYSRYRVVGLSGKKTVFVEPFGSFSSLRNEQLAKGSIVKIYKNANWNDLTEEEQQDYRNRGFTQMNYVHHTNEENLEAAKEVEILKTRKAKDGYSYDWELSDGTTFNTHGFSHNIEHVRPLKRCIVNTKYGEPSIKINDTITATLDENYEENSEGYAEGNLEALMNGH